MTSERNQAKPMPPVRRISAAQTMVWFLQSYQMVIRAPQLWLLSGLMIWMLPMLLSAFGLIGAMLGQFLFVGALGGMMNVAHQQVTYGVHHPASQWAVFQKTIQYTWKPLFVVGGILAIGVLITSMLVPEIEAVPELLQQQGWLMLRLILALMLSVLLSAMTLFAPVLIVLNQLTPAQAIFASSIALWRNQRAVLFFSSSMIILLLLGAIPFFLGWMLLLPMCSASIYLAWRIVLN